MIMSDYRAVYNARCGSQQPGEGRKPHVDKGVGKHVLFVEVFMDNPFTNT